MPKLTSQLPKYRRHKASGNAVVTLGGKDFYLGPHGTQASLREYDRLVGEWVTAGRPPTWPPPTVQETITVSELCARFYQHAKRYYRKNGKPTGTAEGCRPALRLLRRMYGDKLVSEFGPLALKTMQQEMIRQDLSRRYINDNTDRVRRAFRWGASEQFVPIEVVQALSTVQNLAKNRSDARETPPIESVSDVVVTATLPHMPPIVADMVRFQRLTGCRPAEVCMVRPGDVSFSMICKASSGMAGTS